MKSPTNSTVSVSALSLAFAVLTLGTGAVTCTVAQSQTAPVNAAGIKAYEIDVPGTTEWVDTNIDLRGGAKLRFTATGQITYPADQSYSGRSRTLGTFGPDGLPRGFADLIHQYAVRDAGHGALIGSRPPSLISAGCRVLTWCSLAIAVHKTS
jgi:hypothetical protein